MEQSQLIELIRTLDTEEKEALLQFASLPFFNQGKMKAYVPIFLQLCLNHPWKDSKKDLDKKTVFSTLFPDQEFVEGKLEKIMVEAHKVTRTLLLVRHYLREDNEFQQGFDYSEIVRAREMRIRYQHLLSKLQKKLEEKPWKNVQYFYHQYQIEYAIHLENCYQNQVKGDLNVSNVLDVLELHSQLNRLELLNRFLLQQKTAKIDVSQTIKTLLSKIDVPKRYLEDSPALKINQIIFDLLKKDLLVLADIQLLFSTLRTYEKNLDKENLQEFYTYLRNLCLLALTGNIENLEIEFMLHELFKDNLERGYLHYEGKLHPSRYWAVSSNAIRVENTSWAIEFIEKYKHELIGENESHDIYRLNLANYLFGTGRFSECLDNIPSTSPFVDYLLTGKRLEIKAYYELQSELLPYKLEAFKVFLSRTSAKLVSENQKQIHVDFANLLTQISISIPGDKIRAERIIKRIQEKKQAAEWRWLLEKAKALNVK